MVKRIFLILISIILLTSCSKNTNTVVKKRKERLPNVTPNVIKQENKYANIKTYDKFGQWPLKEGEEYYKSEVGTWFTVWWTDEGSLTYSHWFDKNWTRLKPVDYGYYSSGNVDYLTCVLSRLKYMGIDYILLDDTNGHWNDNGLIAKNMKRVFETAYSLGQDSPQVAIATGAPLRDNKIVQQQKELDAYYKYVNDYPGTFYKYKDKPLLVMYIAGVLNARYNDDRFTIRHGTGFVSWQQKIEDQDMFKTEGNWGWVFDIQNEGSEIIGVQPGYNKAAQGEKIKTIYRENGKHYIEQWLAAIKVNPQMIIIPSYNDHAEETGWEATEPIREPVSKDADYGTEGEDPYIYEKITEAYLALKYGFIDGFMYREEGSNDVFLFSENRLTKVNSTENDLVIIIPDGYIEWEKAKNEN